MFPRVGKRSGNWENVENLNCFRNNVSSWWASEETVPKQKSRLGRKFCFRSIVSTGGRTGKHLRKRRKSQMFLQQCFVVCPGPYTLNASVGYIVDDMWPFVKLISQKKYLLVPDRNQTHTLLITGETLLSNRLVFLPRILYLIAQFLGDMGPTETKVFSLRMEMRGKEPRYYVGTCGEVKPSFPW